MKHRKLPLSVIKQSTGDKETTDLHQQIKLYVFTVLHAISSFVCFKIGSENELALNSCHLYLLKLAIVFVKSFKKSLKLILYNSPDNVTSFETMILPPFSLIRDFGKQKHPRKRFQNFRQSYVLLTDRIEIHQSQPLA